MGLGVFKDQVSVMHPGDIPLGADISSCPEFRQQGGQALHGCGASSPK